VRFHFYDGGSVFWWFERGGKYLRYEARALPGGTCELRVTTPDGVEHVETFPDSASLTARQVEFEREFIAEGWTGPHGWNL
jgi:hypothetical protein